jgi:drug/metabolite transporter (DMT)-like permease
MKPSYLLLMVVMNALWAASLSMYKALGDYLEPGGVVTLRFGLAAAAMLVCWPWLPGKAPRGWDLAKTAAMGLLVFMLAHRLQVLGTRLGSAGNSSVLMGVEPLLTSVAAAIFLHEHIGPRRWMGFVLGMFGVALLNGLFSSDFKPAGLWASLVFVSSFLGESAYSIIGKGLIQRASMTKILAISLVCGTIANLLIDGGQTIHAVVAMPAAGWWMGLYLATVCTAIGYTLWFVVIRETDVNITALTIFVQPLAGVAIAAVWLHEPLHWGQLWGGLAIIGGIVWGLSRQVKPA